MVSLVPNSLGSRESNNDGPDNANEDESLQDYEALLRREAPWVYNDDIDGRFDPVRAQLLLQGRFVSPAIAALLQASIDQELQCGARGFSAANDTSDSLRKSKKRQNTRQDTRQDTRCGRQKINEEGFSARWTKDEIGLLVRYHAERADFHTIYVRDNQSLLFKQTDANYLSTVDSISYKDSEGMPGAILQGREISGLEAAMEGLARRA